MEGLRPSTGAVALIVLVTKVKRGRLSPRRPAVALPAGAVGTMPLLGGRH